MTDNNPQTTLSFNSNSSNEIKTLQLTIPCILLTSTEEIFLCHYLKKAHRPTSDKQSTEIVKSSIYFKVPFHDSYRQRSQSRDYLQITQFLQPVLTFYNAGAWYLHSVWVGCQWLPPVTNIPALYCWQQVTWPWLQRKKEKNTTGFFTFPLILR